jgi:hypothetical protein
MSSDRIPPEGNSEVAPDGGPPRDDALPDDGPSLNDEDGPVEDVLSDEEAADARPHCPRCLAPITREQYYCGNCGQSVGELTAALPLINVPFQVDFIWRAWRVMWADETEFGMRLLGGLVVWAGAPFLFLALPVVLWQHFTSPRGPKSAGIA